MMRKRRCINNGSACVCVDRATPAPQISIGWWSSNPTPVYQHVFVQLLPDRMSSYHITRTIVRFNRTGDAMEAEETQRLLQQPILASSKAIRKLRRNVFDAVFFSTCVLLSEVVIKGNRVNSLRGWSFCGELHDGVRHLLTRRMHDL